MRTLAPLLAIGLGFAASPPAAHAAGPLGPTRPSQLVTARAVTAVCPFDGPNELTTPYQVDTMTVAGGSDEPFAIPAKSVLVITSARLTSCCPIPGTVDLVTLVTFDAAGNMGVLGNAATTTPAEGPGYAQLTFPSGVVVRPGSAICVVGPPLSTGAEISGYFTKDR
jgi:hypothetical protein